MKKDGWIKLNEAGELWEGLMVVWPTCFIQQMKRSSVLESFTFLILLLCLSQAIWVSWTGCEQSQKELTHSSEFMLELKKKGDKELWNFFYNLFSDSLKWSAFRIITEQKERPSAVWHEQQNSYTREIWYVSRNTTAIEYKKSMYVWEMFFLYII